MGNISIEKIIKLHSRKIYGKKKHRGIFLSSSVHPVDEKLPLWKLLFFGFQHVLAMYSGAVAVPLVLAQAINLDTERLIYLINADLFTCGIATLVQTLSVGPYIGSKLPIVQGCTFTAVMPMIIIANFWVPSSPASWAM